MVARHEIINIQAWDADVSTAYSLTPYKTLDVSSRADLSIDTLTIVLSDSHVAMPLLRAHRNIPVPVSFELNGVELSGLVTSLKQTKDGETTVTVSGDTKHADRMLARARSSSAIDGAVAQVEAPIGDLTAQLIGEAAQRTGLPVYILQEHTGDLVQVEIGSEDSISDVLAPHLEASDTYVEMRMLLPGAELPGEGEILRVQGRLEYKWEQDRLEAGAWPQAENHERLKRASIIPPTTPMPRLSWAGWSTVDHVGEAIEKTRGVCWMPFDIGQHDRGYWQAEEITGVRVATVEQLAEARKPGWFEHVTVWAEGLFSTVNVEALGQAIEAELVAKPDGSKFESVAEATAYIGDGSAYAWFNGTSWVLATEEAYEAEDAARNPTTPQRQTPAILVHIHAGRDRRNEILFSATDGGGLEDWATTTTSPEAAMVHATTQLSQSTLEALQSGAVAIDPVAGILSPGEASQYVGDLPGTVTSVDVNADPFSTVSGTDISQQHLGGAVNMNVAGAFFYREMTTSTSSGSVNPIAEIGRAYAEAQGSTSIELTPGHSVTSVFGDDVVIDGRVIPGWRPGDRVSFTEGITRISEVISGFELHSAWDSALRITPILARADNGVLDTLARRLAQAERDAANALLQNPRRVPKDDVDTVVDNNDTVKDATEGVEDLREALAGEGATTEDVQEALEALNQQLQEEGETEQSLPLIQAYISANTARWALQQQVDKMQDQVTRELADQQLALKQAFEEDRKNRTERVVATAAGSSNSDHPVTNLSNGNWRISLNDVKNATLIADIWELAGEDRINHLLKQYAPTSSVFQLTLNSNQVFSAEWIRTPGFVRSVNEEWSGSYSLGSASTWYNITKFGAPEIRVGASGTSNFDMSVSVRWPDAWGYYRLQILAGNEVLADEQREGSSTIFKKVPMTQTLTVSNVKIPANTDVRVRASRSSQIASGNYRYTAVTTRASWTERNV